MSGQLELVYTDGVFPEYVRDILSAGGSSLFLPAGFVEDSGTLYGYFETEGYRKLSSAGEVGTEALLGLLLKLLRGIRQTEQIYIFSEMYEIRPDCCFVDRDGRDLRMVYVPARRRLPLAEKLAALLKTLQGQCTEEGRRYLSRAAAYLQEDWGYRALVHRLEELQREAYLCGVK